MASQVDLLVLGPTGYTGQLIVEYLEAHPARKTFTLGIAGRSLDKLSALKRQLSLSTDVSVFAFSVTDYAEVESVVQKAKVIVNCIGPFWKWSTPIVKACARNGVHYVDITGEIWWIRELIREFDFQATKTGAVIIPASGFDSVPSDLAVYLSARSLTKDGEGGILGQSTTAIKLVNVSAFSGGTMATMLSALDEVPRTAMRGMHLVDLVSPVHTSQPAFRLSWTLPHTRIHGGISLMGSVNQKVVYRTWGLLEAKAMSSQSEHDDSHKLRYGPNFTYEECTQMGSRLGGAIWTVLFFTGFAALALLSPLRWFVRRFGPQPGTGPTEGDKARIVYTNVTSTDGQYKRHVKTTVNFKGGAYAITAVLCGESALTLLFDHKQLPAIGKKGGILTPMSALGDNLVKRLLKSGRITYETDSLHPNETRKAV